ncbi:iron-containing alcohol dehydrogenase [Lichenicoccus sp.]|uniref:iron-containing alcohol dehydrogenase n=1 Tax=Lichenicoccus sp. TaxID=2781899 RepID=UPI003D1281EF
MILPVLPLPRLIFGLGAVSSLRDELRLLGVRRPLLISDRGLEKAGAVATLVRALPDPAAHYLDVPENPTAAGADGGFAAYREGGCDGVVAVGGGSVLDSAKIVAALAAGGVARAADLLGKSDLVGPGTAPLIALPTTVGTGSDSSPVAALHLVAGGPASGTRSPHLVPRVAILDPGLARTLPPRLVAATGIDALSHCVEGFFSEPANPIVDALALDGLARAYANVKRATEPDADEARGAMMLAAFAGGAGIHKTLGPAHAIALTCSDQHVHHGLLIAVALPFTVQLVSRHATAKADRLAAAIGLSHGTDLAEALRGLVRSLGLPASLKELGYQAGSIDAMAEDMVASPFNRASPYKPTKAEYATILGDLLA